MEPDQCVKGDHDMEDTFVYDSVAKNPLILQKIFRYFDLTELKTFRAVAPVWCWLATSILKKHFEYTKLRLEYRNHRHILEAALLNEFPLGNYLELDFGNISQYSSIPPGYLCNDLQRLNTVIAESSNREGDRRTWIAVTLDWTGVRGPAVKLGDLYLLNTILYCLKNVKALTLHILNETGVDGALPISDYGSIELPDLEEIAFMVQESTICGFESFCVHLLESAPNLKRVTGENLTESNIWKLVLDSGKGHCLKGIEPECLVNNADRFDMEPKELLDIVAKHVSELEFIEVFSKITPSNSNLSRDHDIKMCKVMASFISKIQKSLKSIRTSNLKFMDFAGPDDEETDPPTFPLLEELELKNSEYATGLLPRRVLMKNGFPALKRVKLDLKSLKNQYVRNYFCIYNRRSVFALPSVQELELSSEYDKEGMKILSLMLPNLKKVTHRQIIGVGAQSLRNGVWELPQSVESITFHFLAIARHKRLNSLDEIFTGIGKKTLEKLPHTKARRTHLAAAGPNGIRKLTALKHLKIIFEVPNVLESPPRVSGQCDSGFYSIDAMETPFFLQKGTFTALSGLYAFRPGRIKTVICYDGTAQCGKQIQQMLSPLQPFVTIHPNYKSKRSEAQRLEDNHKFQQSQSAVLF